MNEGIPKPEKTNDELEAEKDQLWEVMERCGRCNDVGIRSGQCPNHLTVLNRVKEIEKILEKREAEKELTPEEIHELLWN